jgi:aerobic-type carbon monoxide dehydrogenase small subunit (CoxS/CutS family)
MGFDFKVNGKAVHSDAPSLTPLLWVIREELKLTVRPSLRVSWMISASALRSLCDSNQ